MDTLVAKRAAQFLGIKIESLYAYASRGWVRRVPLASGRGYGYVRSDLERLKARSLARKGHGAVASGALRWGEPVLDSAITRIDPARGPIYRGRPAVEIDTLEGAGLALWGAPIFPARSRRRADPTVTGFARAAAAYGFEHEDKEYVREEEIVQARELLACFAGVRGGESISRAFLRSTRAKRQGPDALRLLDKAFALIADHELNASTFAARIAAGAGANLFACVTAALATLSGRRHGAESTRLEIVLEQVRTATHARRWVREKSERGELVPGFGHPLYPKGDPRAAPLLDLAFKLHHHPALASLIRAAERTLDLEPNIDAALVATSHALGMPRGSASAIFALGRTVGWVAHVLEQREQGHLLRPRARYIGP